jgi:polyisoprenoid-binding protein YceI
MSDTLTNHLDRTVDGRPAPAVGRWEVDPTHSHVGFWVRHLGLAKVRGRFAEFVATIEVAADPEASSVVATIEAASIDTHVDARDAHLRSADFLDVEHHPQLHFRSTAVRRDGVSWALDGDLTIRGTTRPVTLALDYLGSTTLGDGQDRASFSATTRIERDDFGLTWNQAVETGGVVVGRTVTIELEIEAVRRRRA